MGFGLNMICTKVGDVRTKLGPCEKSNMVDMEVIGCVDLGLKIKHFNQKLRKRTSNFDPMVALERPR